MVEKHGEAVPLTVPVVGDNRQQPLHIGFRQHLGLLHLKPHPFMLSIRKNLFSDFPEVDRNEKFKVSAVSSGNLMKYELPNHRAGNVRFPSLRRLWPQVRATRIGARSVGG